jgi:hypothetical protein
MCWTVEPDFGSLFMEKFSRIVNATQEQAAAAAVAATSGSPCVCVMVCASKFTIKLGLKGDGQGLGSSVGSTVMNAEDVSKWLGAISEASDAPEDSRRGEGCVSKEAWMEWRGSFLVNAPEEVKCDATVMREALGRQRVEVGGIFSAL